MTDREPAAPSAPGAAQAPWNQPPPQAPWAAAQSPQWTAPGQPFPQAAPTASRPRGGQAPWVPAAPSAPGAQPQRRGMPGGAATWAALVVLLTAAAVFVAIFVANRDSDTTPTADGDRQTSTTDEDVVDEPGTEIVPELPTPTEDSAEPPDPSDPANDAAANGDLGLGVPISTPTCDGSWLVFLGAATNAATYVNDVNTLLAGAPGAQYTLTQGGCSSMRQSLPDGSLIYAVYVGPYPDQASACAARLGLPDGAYVKRMDNSTPPEQLWQC